MEPHDPPPGLRPATAGDLPFLRDVYAAVRWPELAALPWTDAERRAFCDMQFALQDRHYREHYPGTQFLVVTHAAVPVGRLYRARVGDAVEVLDIALLPHARGHGLGTALLVAEQRAAERDGLGVRLYVELDNPARRLYARLGFADGEDAGPYREMTWRPGAQARS